MAAANPATWGLVRECDPMHAEWDRMAPKPLRGSSAGIKSVALIRLMSQFGLDGSRWAKQFIYGFDVMGTFSHDGLFTPGGKAAKPASSTHPFPDAESRFDKRAKAPGWAHDETLWIEAIA